MKRSIFLLIGVFAVFLCSTFTAFAAEVAQGKCTEYNKAKNEITIEEYDTRLSKGTPYGNPTGTMSQFDISKAKIGAVPQPGDILRIAYTLDGKAKKALKVMNVSRQDLRKK